MGNRECAASHVVILGVVQRLTGTFGGAITNASRHALLSVHLFNAVANTWTKIVITIPGDTAGTWVMSGNGVGLIVVFDLGSRLDFAAQPMRGRVANYVGANWRGQRCRPPMARLWLDRRQAGDRQRSDAVQPPVARQEHGRLPEVLSVVLVSFECIIATATQ